MGYSGDKKREYQRRWMATRRQAWIDENGPCVACGSDEDLEVDHVDHRSKRLAPARLWSLALTNPVRIEELAKCQVLCKNCHAQKTWLQLITTEHGSTMYRNGCKCDICRESQKLRTRGYRARLQAA